LVSDIKVDENQKRSPNKEYDAFALIDFIEATRA
jgi:hypothetical protein